MAHRASSRASYVGWFTRQSTLALVFAVGIVASLALSGCVGGTSGGGGGTSGGGGGTSETVSSKPKLTSAEDVSDAAAGLKERMAETESIGTEGAASGWEAAAVVDGVQKAMTATRADIAAAQAYYAAAPVPQDATEGLARLTALAQAINECDEALTLARLTAVAEIAMIQATAGAESAGNAVTKANDEDYKGAVSSAKDAKEKLAKARVQYAELARQYPGADFQNDIAYCEAAVKYADVALDLTRTGRDGDYTEYNKLVKIANGRRQALMKKTDPTARWYKISEDSVTEYNQAIEVLGKVESGS